MRFRRDSSRFANFLLFYYLYI